MTERYDFPNDKFTKMLRLFSVVEAYGLICPSPWAKIPVLLAKLLTLSGLLSIKFLLHMTT